MKQAKAACLKDRDDGESPVSWDAHGKPYSAQFDDIYHTSSGAVEQTDHVFLKGCGLPRAWQNQEHFTILETGFGLGLNFLTTCLRWQQDPLHCAHLHFVSVEAFPVSAQDIAQALESMPELKSIASEFLAVYAQTIDVEQPLKPIPPTSQTHHFVFEHKDPQREQADQVKLTLLLGDACSVLPCLQLQADAVFLDGFSPTKNPELWSEILCKQLASLTKEQGCISTWCVAKQVRQNLELAGFKTDKVQGLAPKRHALVGVKKGLPCKEV